MEFGWSAEELAFRDEVRSFLKQLLPPDWDQHVRTDMQDHDYSVRFAKEFAKKRWRVMHWPKEYGGLELNLWRQVIFSEELAYRGVPGSSDLGSSSIGPMLMKFGTEQQKDQYLNAIANAEITFCQLFTEPGSGSDLASLQTRAVHDGDDYVINGQKVFTSGAHHSDHGWLTARTDTEAPKHRGISTFLIDMKTPGITIRPMINLTGGHDQNEVFFDDVRIPADTLVGEENRGWYQIASSLDSARSSVPRFTTAITDEGDQVVVGHDGEVLSEAAYGLLPEDERGQILFFQRITEDSGQVRLEKIADFAYDELPAGEQGPIRYFRKLSGAGAEFPFAMQADSPTNTVPGDTLTKEVYDRLPGSERGTTRGGGRLLQVRVAATVFLNTTLQALVRKSDQLSPAGEPVWQQVDGGDATALTEGRGLSLSVPVGGKVLDDVVLTPNPFTPNGDGINDELTVSFSVFQVTADRQVRLRIYRLDGRRVWEGSELARGGAHALRWSGVDHAGLKVPPGLYICQLHLDVDADDSASMTASRIVAVAY